MITPIDTNASERVCDASALSISLDKCVPARCSPMLTQIFIASVITITVKDVALTSAAEVPSIRFPIAVVPTLIAAMRSSTPISKDP